MQAGTARPVVRDDPVRRVWRGLKISAAGAAFVGCALIYGQGCDFETAEVCRAFGLWSAPALYVETTAAGAALVGTTIFLIGFGFAVIGGVLLLGRRLLAEGLD